MAKPAKKKQHNNKKTTSTYNKPQSERHQLNHAVITAKNLLSEHNIDLTKALPSNCTSRKPKGVLKVKANTNRRDAGSNWFKQVNTIQPSSNSLSGKASLSNTQGGRRKTFVALDCEMVGAGVDGRDDMLARVSIVNMEGEVLLDKYVKPNQKVTDYRTRVSGIRPHNILNAENFTSVRNAVVQILEGKILVGHTLKKDLEILHMTHPLSDTRDIARYKPLCRMVSQMHVPSLKKLAYMLLGRRIQIGEHSSIEDARAAMDVYKKISKEWELYLKS